MEKKIGNQGFILTGTASEIRATLQEWAKLPITLQEFIQSYRPDRPHLVVIRKQPRST